MIVLDTSVIIKWFKPDEKSSQADFLLEEHISGRESIFIPTLLLYEFINALFYSKSLNLPEIMEATNALNEARLNYINPDLKLLRDTLLISEKTKLSAYDSSYIVLAKNFNCGLITSLENPDTKIMIKLEEYLGRPRYNLPMAKVFEKELEKYFLIHRKNDKQIMVKYFLTSKK